MIPFGHMYKEALRLSGEDAYWAILVREISEDLDDYGYRLIVVPHMNSYAAQDEKNKIIYLAKHRRGKKVSFQDAAWSAYHDLGHVVDERTDDEYIQDFAATIVLERACDRFGLHRAIQFMDSANIPHTLKPDDWKAARYSTPKHVAEWLEGFNKGRGFEQLDQKQVHAIADALNILWDNDEAFMTMSEKVTGKKHLDDMNRTELWRVVLAMVQKVLGRAPDMTKESAPRLNFEKTAAPAQRQSGTDRAFQAAPAAGAVAGGAWGFRSPTAFNPKSMFPRLAMSSGRARAASAVLGAGMGATTGWLPSVFRDAYRAARPSSVTKQAFSLTETQKRRLRVALGAATGAGVAGLGIALALPGTRAHIGATLRAIGKGGVHALERAQPLHPQAIANAKKVTALLKSQGVDPRTARIAVSGTGATGKSSLATAIGNETGATVKLLDDALPQRLPAYLKRHPLQDGTVAEQSHLLLQTSPEKYDAIIRVHAPIKEVKRRMMARKRGAMQLDWYDVKGVSDSLKTVFQNTRGRSFTPATGIEVKIKPPGGFQADRLLDEQLAARGIKARNLSREQRVYAATTGKVRSDVVPYSVYIKKKKIGKAGLGIGAAGAGGGYAADKLPSLGDRTKHAGAKAKLLDSLAVAAVGAGAYDLYRSRGLSSARGELTGVFTGGEHDAVNIDKYVQGVDPSITVVNTPEKVDKMMEKEFKGKWKPLMRLVLKDTVEFGDNAFAYRGVKGDYVIGTGEMPKAVVDHEIGHIQDFREKGMHMTGGPRLGEYVTGYVDHIAQQISKKRFMKGRHRAEVEAWERAPESEHKEKIRGLGLETYEKAFHKNRGALGLLAGAPHLTRRLVKLVR